MHPLIAECLPRFRPVDLAALNAKAAMLERIDQKYVCSAERLAPAFADFADHFDMLEIGGLRAFTYDTRYFDSPDARAYHDHHQGRRKRCKVRVRHYVEAGQTWLEVKLKDRRAMTVKKRLRLERMVDVLDARAMDFVATEWRALYETDFGPALAPVLDMTYRRLTLVARKGGERMTVDTGLSFDSGSGQVAVPGGTFVLETKSANGRGHADAILRCHHMQPTPRVSKYCVGMAATAQVSRRNRFLPALRRLALEGPAPGQAPCGIGLATRL
ncbi:MAG TPA: polyphosphate polymerase domain-containing protein [Paracoccaceae bacterium]|nr:polyphosphate polymerase domain-containing protein [Paracoccaceae bacterium]HMO72070.1 polyphosphate polymerase domain-containing protein [Paracoccaceae bacterium]